MLTAISRYGVRVAPGTEAIIEQCKRTGQLVQGPAIEQFERAFEARIGQGSAIAASYGRMAFYHILKALELPAGSEIIVPALTFWVIPELARAAGLRPVFADVNPDTFTLDPASLEQAIGPRTVAVVPTHLYGLPCDMDPIMDIARRHRLAVVEDCAHALGATYRGRHVGTFGDGALFSFQTLKPLNAYGGGLALVRDAAVAKRVREQVSSLPWPSDDRILNRLRIGRLQRLFTSPGVFTATAFPILWAASWFDWNPDVYLWEPIRRLDALPSPYAERFSNVQAAIGLAGLERLDDWTAATREHARKVDAALKDLPGVQTPHVPPHCVHVYYQYCIYTPDRDRVVTRCIRHGVDLETLHVDVCSRLPLFDEFQTGTPGAERTEQAIQVPVYASLSDEQMGRIATTVRRVLSRNRWV
jgi:dTDP-4-amino-4,6-dideoxygalactose transaminase